VCVCVCVFIYIYSYIYAELLKMLETLDLDGKDIRLIRNLYWGQTACVRVGNEQ